MFEIEKMNRITLHLEDLLKFHVEPTENIASKISDIGLFLIIGFVCFALGAFIAVVCINWSHIWNKSIPGWFSRSGRSPPSSDEKIKLEDKKPEKEKPPQQHPQTSSYARCETDEGVDREETPSTFLEDANLRMFLKLGSKISKSIVFSSGAGAHQVAT